MRHVDWPVGQVLSLAHDGYGRSEDAHASQEYDEAEAQQGHGGLPRLPAAEVEVRGNVMLQS